MAFTTDNARAMGRKGGRSTLARHGRDHMAEIGRLGFAGLAKKLGFMGGSRRMGLAKLIGRGKLRDRSPDPAEAIAWADRVLEDFDPGDPIVPY